MNVGLLIVIVVNMAKDAREEWFRHKNDRHVNESITTILGSNGHAQEVHWQDVPVGSVLLLKDGDRIPADVVVLATSDSEGAALRFA